MSSILSIAVADITLSNEEADSLFMECPIEGFSKVGPEQEGASLLSVLDDKNRLIAGLRKQLQNQKSQLNYYIKRQLTGYKIDQLSLSCRPQASEESLPLNMAINKFCRQAGIKTKLAMLHERMNRLDCKISNSLKDQEFLLRKIVNKLCDFLRFEVICCVPQEKSKCDFKKRFGDFIDDPLHISLFNKLLTATIELRRRLEGFKISCDRVLLVEEERNAIVEQVYSLPVEERTNRNYLVEIQMEKARLESEIKRVLQQPASRDRFDELDAIEGLLQHLQWQLNCTFMKSEESCISKMLEKINSEAKLLLEVTKQQKRNFCKPKSLEPNRVLLFINLAARDKLETEDLERWGIKTDEELKFFELVRHEVDALKTKLSQETEKNRTEGDLLKKKLNQLVLDNSRDKMANRALQCELEELRLEHVNAVEALKQERDLYRSQVEDLQAIREAYAQLVGKQPHPLERLKLQKKDHKISELKKLLAKQVEQLERLKGKVADQRDQVLVLNSFIKLTRPSSPTVEDLLASASSSHCKRSKKPRFQIDVKKIRCQRKKCVPKGRISRKMGDFESLFVTQRNYALVTKSQATLEKSSLFSMEIQFKNSALLELDEGELFKDVSRESMAEIVATSSLDS